MDAGIYDMFNVNKVNSFIWDFQKISEWAMRHSSNSQTFYVSHGSLLMSLIVLEFLNQADSTVRVPFLLMPNFPFLTCHKGTWSSFKH